MSFTFSVATDNINCDAWRIMTGMQRCSVCRTFVGSFRQLDADEHWTGKHVLLEMSDLPDFGTEHTPGRCQDLRGTANHSL